MKLFNDHIQALQEACLPFCRHPWSNVLTLFVIGVALVLPLALGVILDNVQEVARGWNVGNQMTIYLKDTATPQAAQGLTGELRKHPGVDRVDYLTKEQTLQAFQERSGFADALALLPENPLPAIIVVHPNAAKMTHLEMGKWAEQLKRLPQVELVQLDQEWLERLAALITVADRVIWMLAGLFMIAISLIMGNMIRLLIENRKDEIELIDIMGASHPFVRRPFLYTGLLFGFFGGLLACVFVSIGLLTLQQPIAELSNLYHSTFLLSGMSAKQVVIVLLSSSLAGWLSAYVVVTHYLYGFYPRR